MVVAEVSTAQPLAPYFSVRLTTPRFLPQKLAITAGTPETVPLVLSTPATPKAATELLAFGKTWCMWPIIRTSMPGTCAR